MLLRDYYQK